MEPNDPNVNPPVVPNEPAGGGEPQPNEFGPFKSAEEMKAYNENLLKASVTELEKQGFIKIVDPNNPEPEPKPTQVQPNQPDPLEAHLEEFDRQIALENPGLTAADRKILRKTYAQSLMTSTRVAERIIENKILEAMSFHDKRAYEQDRKNFFSSVPEFQELEEDLADLIDNYKGKKPPTAALLKLKDKLKEKYTAPASKAENSMSATERALASIGGYMEPVASGASAGGHSAIKTEAALMDAIIAAQKKGDKNEFNKRMDEYVNKYGGPIQ